MNEQAFAKLNVGLSVGRRQANGFHDLCSIICPLELCDEIRVELVPLSGEQRRGEGPDVVVSAELSPELEAHLAAIGPNGSQRLLRLLESPENLAWKAARLLLELPESARSHCRIHLLKRIPPQAGLGGGSSDAAAVLRAVSRVICPHLSPERLSEIALSLGSDVPALLSNTPVLISGVGEKVSSLSRGAMRELVRLSSASAILLCKPPWGSPTGEMYQSLSESRERAETAQARDGNDLTFTETPLTLLFAEGNGEGLLGQARTALDSAAAWEKLLKNDFQEIFLNRHPEMQAVRVRLLDFGAEHVILAGSGSTFAAFFSESRRSQAAGFVERGCQDLARAGYFLQWTRLKLMSGVAD